MPDDENNPSDDDDEAPDFDRVLEDNSRYEHKQRLKQIFKRIDEADAKYKAAEDDEYDTNEFDYYVSVKSLAASLEPLASRHVYNSTGESSDEELTDLWLIRELGTVEMHPPDILLDIIHEDTIRVVGNPEIAPVEKKFTGLDDFLGAPRYFRETWTVTVQPRHHQKQPINREVRKVMPSEISFAAYRCCLLFLERLGVELHIQDTPGEAIGEYTDVFDNQPEDYWDE